jgi:hypothetical protein
MFGRITVGYFPDSMDLSQPGIRRRKCDWSKESKCESTLRSPRESDFLVLSTAANFDYWLNRTAQSVVLG